jgi:hypothetical protein
MRDYAASHGFVVVQEFIDEYIREEDSAHGNSGQF